MLHHDNAPMRRTSNTRQPSTSQEANLFSIPARQLPVSAGMQFHPANLTSKTVMALQRTHGNRFVQTLIQSVHKGTHGLQRKVIETKANYKTLNELNQLSLSEFYAYTQTQIDWPKGIKTEESRMPYLELLDFATGAYSLSACGDMAVEAFLRLNRAQYNCLRTYAAGVANDTKSISLTPVHHQKNPRSAAQLGEIMERIQKAIREDVAHKVITHDILHQLIISPTLLDNFVNYFNPPFKDAHHRPNVECINDIVLYINFSDVVHKYADAPALKGRIKNFHRFEKAALKQLKENFESSDKSRPLTLIIHSSSDPSGSFHHDNNLTKVIQDQKSLTLMLEVITSLDEIKSQFPNLAKNYGKNKKIDQVLFAGHGQSHSLAMMPEQKNSTPGNTFQNLDALRDKAATGHFFKTLIENMAQDSKTGTYRRIVFQACLANSNQVVAPAEWPSKLEKQQRVVRKSITKNPSLAAYLREHIGDKKIQVIAANGSIRQAKLVDDNGALQLSIENDPQITNPDKNAYVEEGIEPQGVLFAVMEGWSGFGAPKGKKADRQIACFKAMNKRLALPERNQWDEIVIRAIFDIILNYYHNDGSAIQNLVATGIYLRDLARPNSCTLSLLEHAALLPGNRFEKHAIPIFKDLRKTAEWKNKTIELVIEQAWMLHDPSHETDMMRALSEFDGQTLEDYLDCKRLESRVERLLKGEHPQPAKLLLAYKFAKSSESAQDFLRGFGRKLNQRLTDLKLNKYEVQTILKDSREDARGGTDQYANLGLKKTGMNNIFLEAPSWVTGTVISKLGATIYLKDDLTQPMDDVLNDGEKVYVLGQKKLSTDQSQDEQKKISYAIWRDKSPNKVVFVASKDIRGDREPKLKSLP